ncbi:type I restriction endonuclease subunit R [Bacillus mycoides]|uniref:type I restriction endonuclease subunit R n=1 Tax=Bacillus mycoides TaxID=1405 RepID=UPI00355693B5
MANFDEARLEDSIIKMLEKQGYDYSLGSTIVRDYKTVLLEKDLIDFLTKQYQSNEITDLEISRIVSSLTTLSPYPLYDANREIMTKISDGFILKRENPQDKDFMVSLIDFENPENNKWRVVNQFTIKGSEENRRPDVLIFINGLPLVVWEFKSAIKEDTSIVDAYKQVAVRYRRGIPELLKYNAFTVISDGVNNKYGSIFAPQEYFYAWRRVDEDSKEVDGLDSLFTMVEGLFDKKRLLAVIKDYIYFPDDSQKESKIVVRYPQFFAASKLFKNVKSHLRPDGDGKGGTYFGATGSGKSYTMLFLTRLLMQNEVMKNPTILIITDRSDLDEQMGEMFAESKKYIGDDTVLSVKSRQHLREELTGRQSGGVYLTTIQKFSEDTNLLSERTNIICISDEAHRSQTNLNKKTKITDSGVKQSYGFARYLHDGFPNATFVGFSGTPVDATIDVFGPVIDSYTMTESVRDGITVDLIYEGRAARVNLDESRLQGIEDYYLQAEKKGANEYQIEESKKSVASLQVILSDPERLRAVAEDFVAHYEKRVEEGATVKGKALFVSSSREAAYLFYQLLNEIRPDWFIPQKLDDTEKDSKPIEKVKLVMTRSKDDEKELYDMLGDSGYRSHLAREYKKVSSNFKIVIVVDMWLTGFDIPSLDTIYIDKPIQKHTLIQTISRVNRVYEGKERGLIVDYIGIKKNLNEAMRQYTNYQSEELPDISQAIKIVRDELEVLDKIFYRFNKDRYFNGDSIEQLQTLKEAVEFVQVTEELENRFMYSVKRLKSAFNLCSTSDEFTSQDRDNISFYAAVRSILFKLTKGEAPDLQQMNAKVKELLEAAIISEGVEQIYEIGKDTKSKNSEIDIFSDEYLARINAIVKPNTKIKILQQLLQQSIENFKKVNKIKGLEFEERLRRLVASYNDRRKEEAFASEVLDEVAEHLSELMQQLKDEKNSFKKMGIDYEEKAFYDVLKHVRDTYEFDYPEDKLIQLSKEVKKIVEDKSQYTDWNTRMDIKAQLQVDLILLLANNGYPPVALDEAYKEVLEQAENLKNNL